MANSELLNMVLRRDIAFETQLKRQLEPEAFERVRFYELAYIRPDDACNGKRFRLVVCWDGLYAASEDFSWRGLRLIFNYYALGKVQRPKLLEPLQEFQRREAFLIFMSRSELRNSQEVLLKIKDMPENLELSKQIKSNAEQTVKYISPLPLPKPGEQNGSNSSDDKSDQKKVTDSTTEQNGIQSKSVEVTQKACCGSQKSTSSIQVASNDTRVKEEIEATKSNKLSQSKNNSSQPDEVPVAHTGGCCGSKKGAAASEINDRNSTLEPSRESNANVDVKKSSTISAQSEKVVESQPNNVPVAHTGGCCGSKKGAAASEINDTNSTLKPSRESNANDVKKVITLSVQSEGNGSSEKAVGSYPNEVPVVRSGSCNGSRKRTNVSEINNNNCTLKPSRESNVTKVNKSNNTSAQPNRNDSLDNTLLSQDKAFDSFQLNKQSSKESNFPTKQKCNSDNNNYGYDDVEDGDKDEDEFHLILLNQEVALIEMIKCAQINFLMRSTLLLDSKFATLCGYTQLGSHLKDNTLALLFGQLKKDILAADKNIDEIFHLTRELKFAATRSFVLKRYFWQNAELFCFYVDHIASHLPRSNVSLIKPESRLQRADELEFSLLLLELLKLMLQETETMRSRAQCLSTKNGQYINKLIQSILKSPPVPRKHQILSSRGNVPLDTMRRDHCLTFADQEIETLCEEILDISTGILVNLLHAHTFHSQFSVISKVAFQSIFEKSDIGKLYVSRLMARLSNHFARHLEGDLSEKSSVRPCEAIVYYEYLSFLSTLLKSQSLLLNENKESLTSFLKLAIKMKPLIPESYPITNMIAKKIRRLSISLQINSL